MKTTRCLIAVMVIWFWLMPTANAADDLRGLLRELEAMEPGQDLGSCRQSSYDWGQVFAYQASNNTWWTGLAIFNVANVSSSFLVGCFDQYGTPVCRGYFTLGGVAQRVDMLSRFMTQGTVPARGSLAIFATEVFVVDKFTGNSQGGFAEVEKEGLSVQ